MRKKVKFDLIRVKEDGKEVWKDGSLIIQGKVLNKNIIIWFDFYYKQYILYGCICFGQKFLVGQYRGSNLYFFGGGDIKEIGFFIVVLVVSIRYIILVIW